VTDSVEEVIAHGRRRHGHVGKLPGRGVENQRADRGGDVTAEGRGRHGILSLPEFIKAYENQLVNVTSHMTRFSEAAAEIAELQKRVQEHARVMEGTIDGLRNMACRSRASRSTAP
jgi:hypothetical protein